jgi:hypothetical protein
MLAPERSRTSSIVAAAWPFSVKACSAASRIAVAAGIRRFF